MLPAGPGGLGRALIGLGLVLVALGLVVVVADRFPGLRIGRLPGDLSVERPGFRLYVPLATSLLVSLVLSLLLWLFSRRGG
jgi:hypothetical protein